MAKLKILLHVALCFLVMNTQTSSSEERYSHILSKLFKQVSNYERPLVMMLDENSRHDGDNYDMSYSNRDDENDWNNGIDNVALNDDVPYPFLYLYKLAQQMRNNRGLSANRGHDSSVLSTDPSSRPSHHDRNYGNYRWFSDKNYRHDRYRNHNKHDYQNIMNDHRYNRNDNKHDVTLEVDSHSNRNHRHYRDYDRRHKYYHLNSNDNDKKRDVEVHSHSNRNHRHYHDDRRDRHNHLNSNSYHRSHRNILDNNQYENSRNENNYNDNGYKHDVTLEVDRYSNRNNRYNVMNSNKRNRWSNNMNSKINDRFDHRNSLSDKYDHGNDRYHHRHSDSINRAHNHGIRHYRYIDDKHNHNERDRKYRYSNDNNQHNSYQKFQNRHYHDDKHYSDRDWQSSHVSNTYRDMAKEDVTNSASDEDMQIRKLQNSIASSPLVKTLLNLSNSLRNGKAKDSCEDEEAKDSCEEETEKNVSNNDDPCEGNENSCEIDQESNTNPSTRGAIHDQVSDPPPKMCS